MGQYVTWSAAAVHDDLSTDPDYRRCCRAWAAQVIGRRNRCTGPRCRDDPPVTTCELANEPRCEADTTRAGLGRGVVNGEFGLPDSTVSGGVDDAARNAAHADGLAAASG